MRKVAGSSGSVGSSSGRRNALAQVAESARSGTSTATGRSGSAVTTSRTGSAAVPDTSRRSSSRPGSPRVSSPRPTSAAKRQLQVPKAAPTAAPPAAASRQQANSGTAQQPQSPRRKGSVPATSAWRSGGNSSGGGAQATAKAKVATGSARFTAATASPPRARADAEPRKASAAGPPLSAAPAPAKEPMDTVFRISVEKTQALQAENPSPTPPPELVADLGGTRLGSEGDLASTAATAVLLPEQGVMEATVVETSMQERLSSSGAPSPEQPPPANAVLGPGAVLAPAAELPSPGLAAALSPFAASAPHDNEAEDLPPPSPAVQDSPPAMPATPQTAATPVLAASLPPAEVAFEVVSGERPGLPATPMTLPGYSEMGMLPGRPSGGSFEEEEEQYLDPQEVEVGGVAGSREASEPVIAPCEDSEPTVSLLGHCERVAATACGMDMEALCAENLWLRQEIERQRLQIQELAVRAAFGSGALRTPPGSEDGCHSLGRAHASSADLEPAEEPPAALALVALHDKAPQQQPPLGPPAPTPPTPLASPSGASPPSASSPSGATGSGGRAAATSSGPTAAQVSVAVARPPDKSHGSPISELFAEGRRVEAFYQDKWFAGTIVGMPGNDKEGRWAVQCDVDKKGEVLYTKHVRRMPEASSTVSRFISTGSATGAVTPRVAPRSALCQSGTHSVPVPGRGPRPTATFTTQPSPPRTLAAASPLASGSGYPAAAAAFRVALPATALQRVGVLSPPRSGAPGSPEPVRRQQSVGTPITPRYVGAERTASPGYLASSRTAAVGSSAHLPAKQARVLLSSASGASTSASGAAVGGAAAPAGGFARPMQAMQTVWGASTAAVTALHSSAALGNPGSPQFGSGSSITVRAGGSPLPGARLAGTPMSPRLR